MQLMFNLLCFAGLAFMFFCIQRTQERMFTLMREEHAQLRTLLRALEARLDMVEEEALNLPPEEENPGGGLDIPLQPGATVEQASEMLRAVEGLRSLDLESDQERTKGARRMPALKF